MLFRVSYIQNGSPVLWCFLDASKAFDLGDHSILFKILVNRGLPLVIVRVFNVMVQYAEDAGTLGLVPF